MSEPVTKGLILATIRDLVADFAYTDRKEDEELTVTQLNKAFKDGTITIDEAVDEFRKELTGIDK